MMCFFFKQKTAYEMRISDWSSDVCSSDLGIHPDRHRPSRPPALFIARELALADHQPAVAAFEAQPVERILRPRRHRAARRARHPFDHDIGGHVDRLETGEAAAFLIRRPRAD